MEKPIQISIISEVVAPGRVALHVVADRLPDHFLGMAFHLRLESAEIGYDGYKFSEQWSENFFALSTFREQPGQRDILFGMSSRGQPMSGVIDSPVEIATFFVRLPVGQYSFSFVDSLLSIAQDGQRIDVDNVQFQGSEFEYNDNGLKLLSSDPGFREKTEIVDIVETQKVQNGKFVSNIFASSGFSGEIPMNPSVVYSSEQYIYLVIFALVLALGVGLTVVLCHIFQRKR